MLCNAHDDMSNFSIRSKHQRCYSHERALAPLLLVLLFGGTVGGAFASILVPPHLAIEDCSDCFFAQGMAGCDVKEFLGGSRTLAS